MSNIILFEDIFEVNTVNPDGRKFDKAFRIEANSQNCDMKMTLDINNEIYPLDVTDKFTMALASTLNYDGTPDTGYYIAGKRKSLADKYEYVMHGKLYKLSEEEVSPGNMIAEMYASFGGLLMLLKGDPSYVSHFELDQRVFLLIRKISK